MEKIWKIGKILPLTLLVGCQSTKVTRFSGIDGADFCDAAKPIYYSRKDTLKTVEQVKEHNAVGKALDCGWGK